MTETINSRFFLLVTGKSIAEKPHNRINFQDMQLVSLRAVFVSILIFVRSGAGVRRDQSRHLVFMKTIRQSGKLTRDRNQFSRDVNGRSTNESYICRFFLHIIKKPTSALRLNLKDFAHAKSEFTITDKGKGMVFTILFLRICMQILVSIYGAILLWLFCKRLARTSFI